MKCPDDIATFNKIKQEQRLYQLLTGIYEKFEVIKRDILIQEKTLLVESAYVVVRREAARLQILKPTTSSERNTSLREVKISLTARNRPPGQGQGWSCPKIAKRRPSQQEKEDKSHLHCTHCGRRNTSRRLASKLWVISNGGKILNQKIARLPPPWASHRPPVIVVVTPE